MPEASFERPVPAEASRIRAEAADWIVRLAEAPAGDPLHGACAAWCAQDARHAQALDAMRRMWEAVTPQTPCPEPPRPAARRMPRAAWPLLALLPCALFLGAAVPWRYWLADHRTAAGEVRSVVLADGSRLTLNGDSAVDVDLRGDARRVRLRRGEVYVEVAHDGTPFMVIDRDGAVRALGTRYAVRRDEADTLVTVVESRVRVRPRDAREDGTDLAAGQQIRFDRRGLVGQPRAAAPGALAWQQGRLVFDDASLAEVLRELRRHRPGLLLADEASLSHLRFTGVLPAQQSDQALALLASALPLHVSRLSPWLVRIQGDDAPH